MILDPFVIKKIPIRPYILLLKIKNLEPQQITSYFSFIFVPSKLYGVTFRTLLLAFLK